MSSKLLELCCNKNLIDSSFEGYKLSLNEVPSSFHELPVAVNKFQCIGDSFSYLSVALHSMHDHLIKDPWHETLFFFINESMKLVRITVNPKSNTIEDAYEVLQIPVDSSRITRYNASLIFANETTALVTDGSGLLHIVNTGERNHSPNWTIEYSGEVIGENNAFTILDARRVVKESLTVIHCLLISIEERPERESSSVSRASTALYWLEIQTTDNNRDWIVQESFKITSDGVVRFGYFEPECQCLFLESTKPLQLPNDDDTLPIATAVEKEPQYFWQQSSEDIKIWCALPNSCANVDVTVDVSATSLYIGFKSDTFLSGETFRRLDPKLTTWNVVDNRLEVTIWKQDENLMWQYLVKNDSRGEEVVDAALVSEIHEKLAHLCSENKAPADDTTPTFNPGQLEACDNVLDEDSRLFVIDAETKKIVKEINLSGYQKLFNIRLNPSEAPYLCIRHDVDGILWKLDGNDDNICEHFGTLKAFGYVLASKQWKYSTCSSDLSYSVIAATKQNLFIYKQNCHVDSELRNRKTNEKFSKVGKQYLITLNTCDEILGIHAANEFVLALTKKCIHLFDMKDVK